MSPTRIDDVTVPGPGVPRLGMHAVDRVSPLEGGACYEATDIGAGFEYTFAKGALASFRYLTCDFLVEGENAVYFQILLMEGETGPSMCMAFSFLNYCQGRVRMPLEAADQNRWMYQREGAWLKPLCGGARVRLENVDRLRLEIVRKSEDVARFCCTPLLAVRDEPARLDHPLLPRGPLLDEFGQSTSREWKGKIRDEAMLRQRMQAQLSKVRTVKPPEGWSRWGGSLDQRFAATGFFRVEQDARRFWLVDPDGYAFWSTGIDCVHARNFSTPVTGLESAFAWLPDRNGRYADAYRRNRNSQDDSVEFHVANLIRVFGEADWPQQWEALATGAMTEAGFNTVGNWSDNAVATRHSIPYVMPLEMRFRRTTMIFRDFPDIYSPQFDEDVAGIAAGLIPVRDDPCLIGYFLGNEPTWGFAELMPAEGMLINTEECHTRRELRRWLESRYGSVSALSSVWGTPVCWESIERGRWQTIPDLARKDLELFSTVMVERLFGRVRDACRKVDPNHLNLGARYHTVPPAWAVAGMQSFDVFSINCYKQTVPDSIYERLVVPTGRPVLIGEWHFGALDVGLPASGIGRVADQAARGAAFRFYVEQAAAKPWCVGVHYFTLYDQSASGRFDGENYNIGFLDVCEQPYMPLVEAARLAHEHLYDVASGRIPPYDQPPGYLPMLFY